MSIIYDALKKVEKAKSDEPGRLKVEPQARRKRRYGLYLLNISVVILGIFIANLFFGLFTKPSGDNDKPVLSSAPHPGQNPPLVKALSPAPKKQEENPTPPKKETAPPTNEKSFKDSIVLNGVFSSDNENYALLNNQIVKEGDAFEGAKIKKIGLNEVELELSGGIIKIAAGK